MWYIYHRKIFKLSFVISHMFTLSSVLQSSLYLWVSIRFNSRLAWSIVFNIVHSVWKIQNTKVFVCLKYIYFAVICKGHFAKYRILDGWLFHPEHLNNIYTLFSPLSFLSRNKLEPLLWTIIKIWKEKHCNYFMLIISIVLI